MIGSCRGGQSRNAAGRTDDLPASRGTLYRAAKAERVRKAKEPTWWSALSVGAASPAMLRDELTTFPLPAGRAPGRESWKSKESRRADLVVGSISRGGQSRNAAGRTGDLPASRGTRYRAAKAERVRKAEEPTWWSALSVGAARFELTTSCSQSRRDTGLRYAPKKKARVAGLGGEGGIRTPGTE